MKKIILLIFVIFFISCGQIENSGQSEVEKQASPRVLSENTKITFVELGSVNCIPCKKMQPVMKRIEEKYGSQVQVIFYDVWRPEQRSYAEQYKIRLIPTQVFLNSTGEEVFRHEGFFPESEIDKFLQSQGLIVQSGE